MASDQIRVGIIGGNSQGSWGTHAHLPAIQSLAEFRPMGIATTRQETADATGKAFGIPLAFGNPRDLLRHPDIDVVSICVRVPHHHEFVMAALDHGKHVFCEWPLGVNSTEAEEMAALADAKHVRHIVGLQARVSPAIQRLRELVAEGYAGRVLSVSMVCVMPWFLEVTNNYAYLLDNATGASMMSIPGGHSIDALCYALGDFRSLTGFVGTQIAQSRRTENGEMIARTSPDLVMVQGLLENDAAVSIEIRGSSAYGGRFGIEVLGTEGRLVVTPKNPADYPIQIAEMTLQGQHGSGALESIGLPPAARGPKNWGPASNVAQLYIELGKAIREDRPATPDFHVAVSHHRLLETIQRASDSGQRQELRPA